MCGKFGCFMATLLVSGALLGGSYVISTSIVKQPRENRSIEIKGQAKKIVQANKAVWSLHHTAKAESTALRLKKYKESRNLIIGFLKDQGIQESEIIEDAPNYGYVFSNTKKVPPIHGVINIQTERIELIQKAYKSLGDLIDKGVILEGNPKPHYMYTLLDDIRPELFVQATKMAKEGAKKFAQETKISIGELISGKQDSYIKVSAPFAKHEWESQSHVTKEVTLKGNFQFKVMD
ncbi:SIMPL domain-containing protein [Alphaproteobacteria bacterium]|nr:SIMPL domain-containing protein [Alphaproteobacteria bacterium]